MIDLIKLTLQAGKGGDGRVSFHRAKYVPKGGPDGGDGGDGGSLYLVGDKNINTLQDFAGHTSYQAQDGEMGGGDRKFGKKGADLYLHVPLGTVVWEVEDELQIDSKQLTGEQIDDFEDVMIVRQKELKNIRLQDIPKKRVVEILSDGQEYQICKGGKGGRGNDHFKSSTNTTPRYAEKGTPGEKKEVFLELKLLADVGLVGYPNAGKSTFLSLVTHANPKIANYPFTTLTPNLGVASSHGRELVIADIPGIIEGASQGKGLGIQFLRHIERCRVLMFVLFIDNVELTEKEQVQQVWDSYSELLKELREYNQDLLNLPMIITLNKIDLYSPQVIEDIRNVFQQKGYPVFTWSGLSKEGVEKIVAEIFSMVEKVKEDSSLE